MEPQNEQANGCGAPNVCGNAGGEHHKLLLISRF